MKICVYKKLHKKNKKKGFNSFLDIIKFGFYGIQILQSGILVNEQIEIIRRLISRITKRLGFIFIRIFFHHPITKKPLKSRMGKGVGIINN
jgi:large subunit ribosomal protein L16